MTGRWFCPVVFGSWLPADEWVPCGYAGRPQKVLKPRPSTKATRICPSCLSEVK